MAIESASMMAGNFVSRDMKESKYSRAREAAANARGQMSNRQNSILLAGMAACAASDSMAERVLEGKKAARRMRMDMQQNVSEESQNTLDKIKKRLEDKTEENHESTAGSMTMQNGKIESGEVAMSQHSYGEQAGTGYDIDSPPVMTSQRPLSGDINIEI